jgi:hypothetical protein
MFSSLVLLKQTTSGMILEQFCVPDVCAQRFDAFVPTYIHHFKN